MYYSLLLLIALYLTFIPYWFGSKIPNEVSSALNSLKKNFFNVSSTQCLNFSSCGKTFYKFLF